MGTKKLKKLGRKAALKKLKKRRKNAPEEINNASLPAGAPMYYYCDSCGHLSDVKNEMWFLYPPARLCKFCSTLKELGWLK